MMRIGPFDAVGSREERLVAEEESYWLVRKTGEAGEYVEQLDPRGR